MTNTEAAPQVPSAGHYFETTLRRVLLVLSLALAGVVGAVLAYGTLLLALVYTAYLFAAGRRATFVFDAAAWLFIAAFALLALVYSLSARQPEDVLLIFNFIFLLTYLPLVSLYAGAPSGNRALTVANLALLGTLLVLIAGSVEMIVFKESRVGRLASDPIRFGGAAVILGFLSLIGFQATAGWRRWLYLGGPLMALPAIFMTGSRGPFIAFAALSLLATIMLSCRKAVAGLAITGFMALALAVLAWTGSSRLASVAEILREIVTGTPISDLSLRIRFDIYQAGLAAFLDSPWIGHGWQRLTDAPQQYVLTGVSLRGNSHLHNDLLNFAVAGGLGGILAYIAIIAAPLVATLRSPRDSLFPVRLYGCGILSAGYVVLGTSSLMLGFEYPTALYICLAAILLGYCRDTPPPTT